MRNAKPLMGKETVQVHGRRGDTGVPASGGSGGAEHLTPVVRYTADAGFSAALPGACTLNLLALEQDLRWSVRPGFRRTFVP